jgi:hypothetical protein
MQPVLDDSKFFEAALALAQALSQWDLLIIGGTLLIVVGTSYRRPKDKRVRAAYFLFLPAWSGLAFSIYQGTQVQRAYIAFLIASRSTTPSKPLIDQIAVKITSATRNQILSLEMALLCAGVWLVIYIVWWVLSNQSEEVSHE